MCQGPVYGAPGSDLEKMTPPSIINDFDIIAELIKSRTGAAADNMSSASGAPSQAAVSIRKK